MKARWALVVLTALHAVAAETVDSKSDFARLAGVWDVAYEDLALGEIDGTATFDPSGQHVTVVLHPPNTTRTYTLVSESIVQNGDDYTIVLTGENPSSASLMPSKEVEMQAAKAFRASIEDTMAVRSPIAVAPKILTPLLVPQPTIAVPPSMSRLGPSAPPPPDVHIEVPDDVTEFNVQIADLSGRVPVSPRSKAQADRVELVFHYRPSTGASTYAQKPEDQLVGTWRYFADMTTWRDAKGAGRVGYFRRDRDNPNFVRQTGNEIWTRGVPPSQLQLLAVGAYDLKHIDKLYVGVPTVIEAVFDDPQDRTICAFEVDTGNSTFTVAAYRDENNPRRFVSDPFIPSADPLAPLQPTNSASSANPAADRNKPVH